jgi:hypothetical protein
MVGSQRFIISRKEVPIRAIMILGFFTSPMQVSALLVTALPFSAIYTFLKVSTLFTKQPISGGIPPSGIILPVISCTRINSSPTG